MSEAFSHSESGFSLQRQAAKDIISWSNRDFPKNRRMTLTYYGAVLFALPLALFLTRLLIIDLWRWRNGIATSPQHMLFPIAIVTICWTVVSAASYQLLRRRWRETIEISQDAIEISYSGFLAPASTRRIERDEMWRLSFERYDFGREQEGSYSLNILEGGLRPHRTIVANWLARPPKQQLFHILSQIISRRGWDVQFSYKGK